MQPYRSRRLFPAALLLITLTSGCVTAPPLARIEPVALHARGESGEIDTFAASIKTALADIGGRLGLHVPASGLEVFLFDSPRQMKSYLRKRCPEQSGKAAACFAHPGGYVITVVKSSQPGRTDRMVRHEITHYLLASHYRDLPRWIDEGLAQYLEVDPSRSHDDKWRQFRKRRVSSAEQTIVDLVSLPAGRQLTRDQYLLSWALVSFLMQEDQLGPGHIGRYLANVEADGKELAFFESTFGSVTELHPRWESFLARKGTRNGS